MCKNTKTEKSSRKKYRKHKFNGIKIALILRGYKPRIEFYGDIKKILEYSYMLNLKPRIHNNTVEFNVKDMIKLLKTLTNPHTNQNNKHKTNISFSQIHTISKKEIKTGKPT